MEKEERKEVSKNREKVKMIASLIEANFSHNTNEYRYFASEFKKLLLAKDEEEINNLSTQIEKEITLYKIKPQINQKREMLKRKYDFITSEYDKNIYGKKIYEKCLKVLEDIENGIVLPQKLNILDNITFTYLQNDIRLLSIIYEIDDVNKYRCYIDTRRKDNKCSFYRTISIGDKVVCIEIAPNPNVPFYEEDNSNVITAPAKEFKENFISLNEFFDSAVDINYPEVKEVYGEYKITDFAKCAYKDIIFLVKANPVVEPPLSCLFVDKDSVVISNEINRVYDRRNLDAYNEVKQKSPRSLSTIIVNEYIETIDSIDDIVNSIIEKEYTESKEIGKLRK